MALIGPPPGSGEPRSAGVAVLNRARALAGSSPTRYTAIDGHRIDQRIPRRIDFILSPKAEGPAAL